MSVKAIIGSILIAALVIAALLVLRKLNNPKASFIPKKKAGAKKKDARNEGIADADDGAEEDALPPKTTADILPLADIQGPVFVQRDGCAVSVVKVKCKNYSLLSTEEKVREAEATSVVLGSQAHLPLKVIHIQRPVDSTESLVWMRKVLEARKTAIASLGSSKEDERTSSGLLRRNEMLQNLIDDEMLHMKEAGRTKADAYVVLPVEKSVANEQAALQRARDMAEALRSSGFTPSILHPQSLMKLMLDYFGSYRTENENFNPQTWTPIFTGVLAKEEEEDVA